MPRPEISQIDVIAPNFKRRLSGVTATVVRLVPLQARWIAIAAAAPALPDEVPQIPLRALVTMSRSGPSGPRVWHARRNVEMIAGLALKHLLRKRLQLLFTSASQRQHTGLTKWLIRRMDHVVATSARTAAYLERDATVIHHGIDADQFSPPADRAALRRALDLPQDAVIAGCYGRIRAQKGTDVFTDALLNAMDRDPRVVGIVMGRATDRHQAFEAGLRDRIAARGHADRLLFRPEVPVWQMADWYRALDLYIAPQRWEGFGLTPLEAMSCGVPVLATRVGAFEELVAEGTTGRLVPPDDLTAMTEAAADLLSDPARLAALGAAARQHVLQNFRIETEARALVAIYRDLLARA
ncbi:putative lipopolysaccharide core biosynthesis mannosyltransferaseprotein [Pseudooceanicola batsensis HTCC2597]|uniref:Putative lipopolysaccharide core biosynthesis mannosyltransferaseprotein n=1 Tax=Pseudooceanicola batsensis (strain ATCC BAA-863 / DSM 15984 / KCTC 12145 / HTCC2597) TaxID=252305 RepID=A3U1J3_PSEBH|nr:glycosyltransferase family 4 protein [Pseudooceanicola batsensis]EAQ01774.1 putative lipopolysaccharide core biosynthesis mannosyltransferaseprotein [Pseudooceanicola batsensis HTCC2597]